MARKTKPVDETAKRDLNLFADNDYATYKRLVAADEHLARVICRKGAYSVDLAARVYRPILADAAKKYSREYGSGSDGLTVFDAPTRQALAKDYAADFKSRVNNFLKHGTQDLTANAMSALKQCSAKPLAGRVVRRRRK